MSDTDEDIHDNPEGITFSLTPACHTQGIIDYGTSEGIKIYSTATAKLSDELYDCDTMGLRSFLNLVRDRAVNHGWDKTVLLIPDDILTPDGESKYFMDSYSEISLQHLQGHVAVYYDQPIRAAQDAVQLYNCLMNSLSNIGQQKVSIHRDQYTVDGVNNGVLLLKVIIQASHIDTNATTTWIRTELSNLDSYLPKIGHDITKLNEYVSTLLEQLYARGETTHDLFTNLLKGYKAAKDKKFVEYIEKKEEDYEDGTPITPQTLMELADNRFKVLKQKGVWNAPSPEEEKILALEAKIQKLERQAKTKKVNKDTFKKEKGKGNLKQKNKKQRQKPAWMLKPPADHEKDKSKTVDGKEYWWCPKHKSWTRHKPNECQGVGLSPDSIKYGKDKEQQKKLKLTKALAAIAEEDSSDSES